MRIDLPTFAARGMLCISIVAFPLSVHAADASIHSGPLPSVPGTGERLTCIVTNADDKAVEDVRLRIRSLDFGTTVADVSCAVVAPGAACPATFDVTGLPFAAHFACSVDARGRKDALRGTFHRRSSSGASDDLAIDLR
ncbi:MAG: hypothetical protein ABI585_03560 [Betaproteobacteria bacterium]